MRDYKCPALVVGLAVMLSLILGACVTQADPAANYPSKEIELITHSNPGGPNNMIAHLVAEVVQKEKLLSQQIVVGLKPGSGMAKGFAYLMEKKSDAHIIGIVPNAFLHSTPLTQNLPFTYKDFTPICNLAIDGSVLIVNSKSKYNTIKDLIDDAKKRPNEITQGGSSNVSNEALMGKDFANRNGTSWKFVSFAGETEAATAVMGGNIDFAILNPTSIADQVRAGNLRVLLASTPKRYSQFSDAPTIEEAGLGQADVSTRGIIGPPNMPAYAVTKLEAMFKKFTETDAWKKYLDDSLQLPGWQSTKEYSEWIVKQEPVEKAKLEKAGLLKK